MISRDVMPQSLFEDACDALESSVDAFVARTATRGAFYSDRAWMWVTQPWADHNLARVVLAGVAANDRRRDGSPSAFGLSALALTRSIVKLSKSEQGLSTASNAAETAYMAALGTVCQAGEPEASDLISEIWIAVVRRLIDPAEETGHEVDMLANLVLVGVYEAESPRATADRMRDAVVEALGLTVAIEDDFHRRRRALAWLDAGRAALACADEPLAKRLRLLAARNGNGHGLSARSPRESTWPAGPRNPQSSHSQAQQISVASLLDCRSPERE
jgi:hypothetical protein